MLIATTEWAIIPTRLSLVLRAALVPRSYSLRLSTHSALSIVLVACAAAAVYRQTFYLPWQKLLCQSLGIVIVFYTRIYISILRTLPIPLSFLFIGLAWLVQFSIVIIISDAANFSFIFHIIANAVD